jgi:hypothetical protein
MAADASSYTNALEGVYGLLGHDVIVGNFDTTLESESFGWEVEWQGEYGPPTLGKGGGVSGLRPEDFLGRGRIPVVMEVMKRLTLTLGRDAAVACALTGPCSFIKMARIPSETGQKENMGELIKLLGPFFTKLVRGLCELKIDALFFREDPLEGRFVEELFQRREAFKAIYGTLFNIVRAFNAFPVVVTKHLPLESIKEVHGLLKPGGIIFLGERFGEKEMGSIKEMGDSLKLSFGVPLPVGISPQEDLWNQLSVMDSFVAAYGFKNLFYTSDGEIPHDIAMEILHALMDRLRAGSDS